MKKDQFKKLLDECKKYSTIDRKDLIKDMNGTLALQQNLISIVIKMTYSLIKLENEYSLKRKNKYHYYKTDYDYDLSKKELDMYTDADDELKDMRYKIAKIKFQIESLDKQIDFLRNKQFQIKNLIEWEKYTNGVV
jgi:peptidoglycan hydrolase CwlO-like protein